MALWKEERHLWIWKKGPKEKQSGWLTSRGERRGINDVISFSSLLASPRLSFVPALYFFFNSCRLQPNDAINIIRWVKTFQFMVTLAAFFISLHVFFFWFMLLGKRVTKCSLLDKLFFVLNDVLKVPHQSDVHSRNSARYTNEGHWTNWHLMSLKCNI